MVSLILKAQLPSSRSVSLTEPSKNNSGKLNSSGNSKPNKSIFRDSNKSNGKDSKNLLRVRTSTTTTKRSRKSRKRMDP